MLWVVKYKLASVCVMMWYGVCEVLSDVLNELCSTVK